VDTRKKLKIQDYEICYRPLQVNLCRIVQSQRKSQPCQWRLCKSTSKYNLATNATSTLWIWAL